MNDPVCAVDGCDADAGHEPVLVLHAKGHRREEYEPVKIPLGIKFCHTHRSLTAYDILSEEDWAKLCLGFYKQKMVQPDREKAELEWA